jgi:hypothetical protein
MKKNSIRNLITYQERKIQEKSKVSRTTPKKKKKFFMKMFFMIKQSNVFFLNLFSCLYKTLINLFFFFSLSLS